MQMRRARVNQMIAVALALAGITGACAVAAVSSYGYQRSVSFMADEFARERSDYDHCVAGIRRSGDHDGLADLLIDGRCPVKPSVEQLRIGMRLAAVRRSSALQLAGLLLVFCLPWAAGRVSRIKRR